MFGDVVCEDSVVKDQLLETLCVGEKFAWNSSAGGSPCTAMDDFCCHRSIMLYSVGYTVSL